MTGEPFRAGEKAQFTDRRGKKVTFQLVAGQCTQTDHGFIVHDDIIGQLPGSVVRTVSSAKGRAGEIAAKQVKPGKAGRLVGGWEYMVFRPRLIDYQLSMPRGAQIMYPKDIAQALAYGDIRTGMRVVESGGGSGAMSLALCSAVGPNGSVLTIERRAEFAQICAGNIELFYGFQPDWWKVEVAGFDEGAAQLPAASVDRIMLDLLDPWNRLEQAERILVPGGVLVAYITTTTQMSRLSEGLRETGRWTEPEIVELVERTWKAEGLAVRPNHDMVGHTGFLVISRVMAPAAQALRKQRHGSKNTYVDVDRAGITGEQDAHGAVHDVADLELRDISDRKVRKVLRDLERQRAQLKAAQQ